MKRCPTCQKTFADTMRFCQIDGTSLVEDAAPPADPYKTVVSGSEDILSAMPPPAEDPFKTMIGGMPPTAKEDEDDLLQLDEPDPMKTMINPGTFGKEDLKFDQIKEDIKKETPPSSAPPAPKEESKGFGGIPQPPQPPLSGEPNLNPPSFGSSSAGASNPFESKPPKFDSNPLPDKPQSQSPFDNLPSGAIPSPFDLSMPPSYQAPSTPPFGEPEQVKESKPTFSEPPPIPKQNSFDQYQNPPAMGQQMQQTEWTPPPAPESDWQNQNLGANTPFQPPAVGQGDNKTLAIVSLVLGILSLPCCSWYIFAIGALVTGFIAKGKADSDPANYSGRGLALAGMIMGGISLVLGIIVTILFLSGAFVGRF